MMISFILSGQAEEEGGSKTKVKWPPHVFSFNFTSTEIKRNSLPLAMFTKDTVILHLKLVLSKKRIKEIGIIPIGCD